MLAKSAIVDLLKFSRTPRVSLSRYFPKGTNYFYGYPTGQESGFLNLVPPSVEELVSGRPLVCAGNNVSVITFAAAMNQANNDIISKELGSTLLPKKQTLVLPGNINTLVTGKERNEKVRQSLKQLVQPGTLVMAQPFLDEDLDYLYQIPPELTNWLNDKQNLPSYIPEPFLAARYASYPDGKAFAESKEDFPIPCVIKVSSSSAGDGVHICKDQEKMSWVKTELAGTTGAVIIEQYIEAEANYGVQFGIPENKKRQIDIIGINLQLTTPGGEFVGGVIDPKRDYSDLNSLKKTLIAEILPQIRERGWYGVGCFDVLADKDGKFYIIDCNFRMTGMTAYLMLVANKQIKKPLVSFNAEFKGTLSELRNVLNGLIDSKKSRLVHVLAATENEGVCRFNGAILLGKKMQIADQAQRLLDAGISSKALEQLIATVSE